MAITVNWGTKVVDSTASITDLPAFKESLRSAEDTATGILYDGIITYKRLDLGGGAYMHAVDFINGYTLRFPNAGSYTIDGNLGCEIVPVAGVFVDRTKAAAYSTTAVGAEGVTADAVWQTPDLENGKTPRDMMRLFLAALAGKSAGSGTNTVTFRDNADSKDRITGTLDASKNRIAVTLDPS